MSTQSLAAVMAHFSQVIDDVAGTHERVTVTKNGRPVAVILAVEDYESLMETLEILTDRQAVADIREAEQQMANGEWRMANGEWRGVQRRAGAGGAGRAPSTSPGRYSVILSPGAERAIEHDLPEAVAAAVVHFLYGPLAEDPHRVGMPLRFQLEGYWSARRGQYRVIYSIHDDEVVAAPSASLTAPTSTADTSTVHQFGKGSRLRM